MKLRLKRLFALVFIFGAILQVHAQGYIVPNGVTYIGQTGLGYETDVIHDPANLYYTGFGLDPRGRTPPTSTYINTFLFDPIVDVSVRVFLVSENDPISLQPILSQSYAELLYPNSYVFASGVPFYLALYTGNVTQYPANGIYSDPLFGWVELVNNQGVIQMVDSALEYQGGGIYAGTENIIPIPEPGEFALAALGVLLLGFRRWRNSLR
jgi:hypothetical protein